MERKAVVNRKTKETSISAVVCIDGRGLNNISTGIGFLDHMLASLARHGLIDIDLKVAGDLNVDCHHTVEDIGIVLGKALKIALYDKVSIKRFGNATFPMEDALVLCSIDISGRPYLSFDCSFTVEKIGTLETETILEFFRAVCLHGGFNVHFVKMAGVNNHHIAEALFKAFGKAFDEASSFDDRIIGVLSTKGVLDEELSV